MSDVAVLAQALRWLGGLLALGLLALPVTTWLLDPMESQGAGFAITVGSAITTLVVFWVGQVAFGPATVLVGLVVLAALSVIAYAPGARPPVRRYAETSVVFALAFAVAVFLRLDSPQLEIWAEGFLNFGLVKTLFRASALPPEDFWFAAEPVRYYYGGHLSAVIWATLTGTPARVVPNLAVPTTYAMLVTGAYDLGGSIGAVRGLRRRVAGGVTALMLALGGNLFEPIRVLSHALPAGVAADLRGALGLPPTPAASFSWFAPTHFAPFPTDVPVYSVVIGSLHAHVSSQPITLLVVALLFAYYLTPAGERRLRRRRLLAAAPAVGLVLLTNVWSVPTGLGLVALAVAFAPAAPWTLLPDRAGPGLRSNRAGPGFLSRVQVRGSVGEAGRYGAGVLAAIAVGALALLSVAPFLLGTNASRPIAFLPSRTGVGVYLVDYGGFLAAFALLLWPRLRERVSLLVQVLVGSLLLLVAVELDVAAAAIVVPVLLAAWWLLRGWEEGPEETGGFAVLLILAGAGLALLVEFAYVKGGAAAGRYNTVYKVHSQVWLLWSVAAGVALASVLSEGLAERPRTPWRVGARSFRTAAAVVLVVSASLFGAFAVSDAATRDHAVTEELTLDATAFVGVHHPDHAAAIEWLDARPGQPHIVAAAPTEAAMFSFTANPASSLTGLPTIAGWTHAADYHPQAAYDRRVRHVRRIFEGSASTRATLLERYDVRFVYVGPYEWERYDVANLEKGHLLEPRRFGTVTVYAVNSSATPDA
ncbi:MAG: DUF2298 domain-containing protein [Halobacteriaceae archaeon]